LPFVCNIYGGNILGRKPFTHRVSAGSDTSTVTGSWTYTYSWSNVATTASITVFAAGTYTVTVPDGSASVGESTTISEPTVSVPSISFNARFSASGAFDGA
tara:strand:+ start:203 stop:505 length:303 start_codon:yes stop_codon:yes gene_type:complete